MVSPHLFYGIWSWQFLETRIRVIKNGETRVWTNVQFVQHLTQFTNENNLKEWSMIWIMLIFFPQTSILLARKLCCLCLKTTRQWSRWSQREEARKWDMFPEPTELLLIGYLIESIWTAESKSNTLTPKNQLADILTKGNFTRDEWNHLLCLFNISRFSSINCSEVMSKRTQEDSGEERVTAKSKPVMNLVSRCSERTPDVPASTASEKPRWKQDMKVNYLWVHGMSSIKEQGDLFCTLSHQVIQSGMLVRLGLLKSGNLMNWWKLEEDDLLYSHSTRTN